jgi:hypothetical protein
MRFKCYNIFLGDKKRVLKMVWLQQRKKRMQSGRKKQNSKMPLYKKRWVGWKGMQ